MENIEHLICSKNLTLKVLRVYLKDETFLAIVEEFMNQHYGEVAKSYLLADVCRGELLVEIEGIAINK